MTDLLDSSQIRQIGVTIFSAILAFATPTEGFVLALIIAFGFNIFCGMRADGVSVVRCKNFSVSKFKNAILEMLLYVAIVYVIYGIMLGCNDGTEALFAIKMLTYIFCYVYICNAFKISLRHTLRMSHSELFITFSGLSLRRHCRVIGNRYWRD